jgi:hypothetical protein
VPTIEAIGALNDIICMIYLRPEKTEFSYYRGYVSRTTVLYALVLPYGVSTIFLVKQR